MDDADDLRGLQTLKVTQIFFSQVGGHSQGPLSNALDSYQKLRMSSDQFR